MFDVKIFSVTDTQINDEDVSLRVNSDFHQRYIGEPLDVEFSYNRWEEKWSFHFHNSVYDCLKI